MKLWKRLCAAALAAAVAAGFGISSASACTSLFVGSELTVSGSTFFGRGEDIGGDWACCAEDLEIFADMVDDPSGLPENSMFWAFAAINDLCGNDREHYGAKVKEFWESYQNALIEQQAGVDKAMLHIYNADPALAEETATALGKAVAQEAFDYAKRILAELRDFVQAYEAGEVDEDTVFTPSVMGRLPSYSILMAMDDVSSKYWSWYGGHVEYVLENGLMLGESASSFGLNSPVSGNYAVDVLSGLAESDAFAEGLELGDGPVSREDIVVMLWRLAGSKTVDADLWSYADADDISDYAVDAMKWAVDAGLVSGYIDETTSPFSGILRPAQAATRAELAKLLNIFCEDVLK